MSSLFCLVEILARIDPEVEGAKDGGRRGHAVSWQADSLWGGQNNRHQGSQNWPDIGINVNLDICHKSQQKSTGANHVLINYIDSIPKCRQLTKLTCKGTLRQVFICLRPPPIVLTPPPSHTVYCIRIYSILIHTGKGGRGGRDEPERRLEGQQFTKLGRKYQHGLLYIQSINSEKHLPQSPFTGKFFYMTTFCFGIYRI